MSDESTISQDDFSYLILSIAGRRLQQWDGHVHLPVRGSFLVIQGLHNDHYDAYGYHTSMMETFIVNIKPFFPFSSIIVNIKLFALLIFVKY